MEPLFHESLPTTISRDRALCIPSLFSSNRTICQVGGSPHKHLNSFISSFRSLDILSALAVRQDIDTYLRGSGVGNSYVGQSTSVAGNSSTIGRRVPSNGVSLTFSVTSEPA